jgi:hypothetical protein
MFGLLSSVLGLLPTIANTITSITQAIANEKIAAIGAKTDQERIEAEERVKTLEAKRDVLISEIGHSNWDLIMRVLLAMPVAIVMTKIFVWDKVFGIGTTYMAEPQLWNYITAVAGFYFLYSGAMGVTKVFKS